MNKSAIYIIFGLISIVFTQSIEYIDLGVIIKEKNKITYSNDSKIEYMLSSKNKDIIVHELNNALHEIEIEHEIIYDINNINKDPHKKLEQLKNTTLLYLSERYVETIKQIENIIKKDSIPMSKVLIIADALYRTGSYNRALAILNKFSTKDINDDYWILKGLIHKELGEKENQKIAMKSIIELFPNSDYTLVAKLQYKMLSR